MRRLKFITHTAAVVCAAMSVSSGALAAQAAPCSTIQWQPNRVYEIRAKIHHAVHIVLPEPASGKPVSGNPDLWTVDGQSTHVFVKPTNADSPEGASTSITVIGVSNSSYDFTVNRVKGNADECVYIKKEGVMIGADTDWRTSEERRVSAMQQQVKTLQQQLTDSRGAADRKALDALDEYRGRLYSRYKWTKGRGFIGKNVIADVWDDGRFTMIRVNADNRGLMQVVAKLDGKEQGVEYKYDAETKLYKIAGLYPILILHYDKSTVTVTREDDGDQSVAHAGPK